MHIAVCIKQIPDPQAPAASFNVDGATNTPQWSPPAQKVISTFDLHALEAAVQIKERLGARVTVLSLGGPDVEVAVRRAMAAGADAAVIVEGFSVDENNRVAVSHLLAAAIRRLGDVDLVLCGRIAADWDTGHVPMMMAEVLSVPAITPVKKIEIGDGSVTAERLTDDGYEVIELPLPCIMAVSNELNEPRLPTIRGILDSHRKPVETWTLEDLGVQPAEVLAAGSRVKLRRLYEPDLTRACEFVEADSPEEAGQLLAQLLSDQGLV